MSVRTIEREIARGALRSAKPSNGVVRIKRRWLESWLAGGFVLLLVLVAALLLSCRLGLEPAHDAVGWLSRGKVHCSGHRSHRRRLYVYALPAAREQPLRAVVRRRR